MDLKKLDEIINEYCSHIGIFKDTIEQVYPMAVNILKTPKPLVDKLEWSKSVSLDESIKYVMMFLYDIDKNLANQFSNLIGNSDIVKIESRKDNPKGEDCVDGDGIVHIFYENTPNDIFIICHEMLHKLNEQDIHMKENITRDYFGETVSIMGERLLGNYLVQNGIITQNDFEMRKLKRLNGSVENARDIIVESNLLSLKKSGMEINYENLMRLISNCTDEKVKNVLLDESRDLKRIKSIFRNYDEYLKKNKGLQDVLNIRKSQRYVIGSYLTERFIGTENEIDDFLTLHYAVGDKNADINAVVDGIRKKHPTL